MPYLSKIISFLFPPKCVGCYKVGAYMCPTCFEKIEQLSPSPLISESFYPLYSYKNSLIQKNIFLAKYKRVFTALYPFATPIAEKIFEIEKELELFERPIILVPIPSTKISARARGFNQNEVLAGEIKKLYPNDFVVASVLTRARNSKKQTECANRAERVKNMKNAFAIKPNTPISARAAYVLVDDVITTGATVRSAKRALTEAGAGAVLGVSIAYQELR